jgi:hypothetical protein
MEEDCGVIQITRPPEMTRKKLYRVFFTYSGSYDVDVTAVNEQVAKEKALHILDEVTELEKNYGIQVDFFDVEEIEPEFEKNGK